MGQKTEKGWTMREEKKKSVVYSVFIWYAIILVGISKVGNHCWHKSLSPSFLAAESTFTITSIPWIGLGLDKHKKIKQCLVSPQWVDFDFILQM